MCLYKKRHFDCMVMSDIIERCVGLEETSQINSYGHNTSYDFCLEHLRVHLHAPHSVGAHTFCKVTFLLLLQMQSSW